MREQEQREPWRVHCGAHERLALRTFGVAAEEQLLFAHGDEEIARARVARLRRAADERDVGHARGRRTLRARPGGVGGPRTGRERHAAAARVDARHGRREARVDVRGERAGPQRDLVTFDEPRERRVVIAVLVREHDGDGTTLPARERRSERLARDVGPVARAGVEKPRAAVRRAHDRGGAVADVEGPDFEFRGRRTPRDEQRSGGERGDAQEHTGRDARARTRGGRRRGHGTRGLGLRARAELFVACTRETPRRGAHDGQHDEPGRPRRERRRRPRERVGVLEQQRRRARAHGEHALGHERRNEEPDPAAEQEHGHRNDEQRRREEPDRAPFAETQPHDGQGREHGRTRRRERRARDAERAPRDERAPTRCLHALAACRRGDEQVERARERPRARDEAERREVRELHAERERRARITEALEHERERPQREWITRAPVPGRASVRERGPRPRRAHGAREWRERTTERRTHDGRARAADAHEHGEAGEAQRFTRHAPAQPRRTAREDGGERSGEEHEEEHDLRAADGEHVVRPRAREEVGHTFGEVARLAEHERAHEPACERVAQPCGALEELRAQGVERRAHGTPRARLRRAHAHDLVRAQFRRR